MKNLKRVLALVLVVAMFAGLMISTNAAFSDDAAIVNDEAVDVLSAIGVIEGYDDGSYKPEKEVNRAEMAAIICRMLLGDTASALEGAAVTGFSDVAESHWAAGYISYCVSKGIIDGYEDGTYKPTKTVTKAEATKMVLCALGITGEYTGTNWAINVAVDGIKAGLIADGGNLNAGYTRDETALLAFNALWYSKSGTATNDWAYDPIKGEWVNRTTAAADSLATAVHKLATATPATDDFCRPDPGYYYTVKGVKATGVYGTDDTLVAVYKNVTVTGKALYSVIGKAATADYYSCGSEQSDIEISKTSTASVGGLGCIVEVYYDKTTVTIVEICYDTVEVESITKQVVDAYGDVVTPGAVTDEDGFVYYTANPEAFKKGDVVCVTYNTVKDINVTMEKAATITGDLTAYSSKGTVTIGGVAYSYYNGYSSLPDVGTKGATYYLDPLGNVVGVAAAGVAAAAPTAYVMGVDYSLAIVDGKLVYTWNADIILPNGTVANVAIDEASYNAFKAIGYASYSVKDGIYTLTAKEATTIAAVTKGTSKLATGLYANSATLFIVADYAKNAAGEIVWAGTVTNYTGIANVPSLNITASAVIDANADGVAEVVIVANSSSVTAPVKANYVWFTGDWTYTAAGYAYDVIIAGTPSTLTFASYVNYKGLYNVDGTTVTAVPMVTDCKLVFNGGLLVNDGTVVADIAADAVVYVIDSATNAVSVMAAADMTVAIAGSAAVVTNTAGVITTLYIVK